MLSKSPKRSRTTLPELKNTNDKSSDSKLLKSNLTLLQSHKQFKSERGLLKMCKVERDVKLDSGNKTLNEDEKTKRHSKLRTSQLSPGTGKTTLMEKFESSLKERLLNSAHFSKQIPLFDEAITIDKIRNKSPRENLDSNESMFNSVFPARKETGKNSPKTKDLFSKHNKESLEWLQEINSQTDEAVNTESNLIKIDRLSKSLLLKKEENLKRIKRKEQNFSASEVSKYLLEGDKSRRKQDKVVRSADSSLTTQVNKQSLLKLSPITNYRKEKKSSRSPNLQEVAEDEKEAIETVPQAQHLSFGRSFGEGEITLIQKCPTDNLETTSADSVKLNEQLINDNKETVNETVESLNQSSRIVTGDEIGSSQLKINNINRYDADKTSNNIQINKTKYLDQNLSINIENSPETSTKLESEDSLNVNEYQVLYFQVESESEDRMKNSLENAEKDDTSYEDDETKEESNNEPDWFADYGVDKKSRQGMDLLSEKSSEDDDYDFTPVPEETPEIQVQPDEIKEPKKKVKKAIHKIIEPVIETVTEESEVFVSETVREIKTVPLITFDEIPIEHVEVLKLDTTEMPLEYLKKNIGKYLTAGLAKVALFMPRDPVEYLAHWLLNERHKEELIENLKQFKAEVRKVRQENINKIRQNTQMEYLQNEVLDKYIEGDEPQYPKFDSSESESTNVSIHETIHYVN